MELLADPDRGDLGPPGGRRAAQVGAHHVGLAVVPAEPDHRDVVGLSEGVHRGAEPLADPGDSAEEGIGLPRWPVRNVTCPPTYKFGT